MDTLDSPVDVLDLDEPVGNPLAPKHLLLLFTRPTEFFGRKLDLDGTFALLFTGWVVGIATVIERVETRMLQADLRGDTGGLMATLGASWPAFWAFVLFAGIISAMLIWGIGGWWYRKRLEFSGASYPDERQARLVYFYASLVEALPAVLLVAGQTLAYESYGELWMSDSLVGLLGLPFFFLSAYVSYRGATTVFELEKGKALVWFLILPVLVVGGAAIVLGGYLAFLA